MRLWETPSDIQTYNFQFLPHIGKFNKILIKKSHFESLKFVLKKILYLPPGDSTFGRQTETPEGSEDLPWKESYYTTSLSLHQQRLAHQVMPTVKRRTITLCRMRHLLTGWYLLRAAWTLKQV